MESTLAHQAYEGLRGMVAKGQLKPGARLVNRTLAKSLNVSQTPIREAISRLVTEGIAELVPGAGAFVRKIELHDLTHLYEIRERLEPYAACLAAKNAAEFEIGELRRVCADWHMLAEEIRHTPGKVATAELISRWNDREQEFHHLIVTASRNRWLEMIAGNLRLWTAAFATQRREPAVLTLAGASKTWREHVRIVAAIAARDSAAAEERMRNHISHGKSHVVGYLREASAAKSSAVAPSLTS